MKTYAGLIAGLGNPGPEYANTRHNFGFMAVDHLLHRCGGEAKNPKLQASGDCETWDMALVRNKPRWIATKPLTYMNLSGVVVGRIARKHGIDAGRVIVLHDDMDLPLGRMKMKKGGGDAGHNGIKSVAEHLGTTGFVRIRLGVGRPETTGRDWVLDAFSSQERETVAEVIDGVHKALGIYVRRGLPQAVQFVNGFTTKDDTQ